MLVMLLIGVKISPRSGIQDNLGDKGRILGIPVWRPAKNSLLQARLS
jgi:hypothetical protein